MGPSGARTASRCSGFRSSSLTDNMVMRNLLAKRQPGGESKIPASTRGEKTSREKVSTDFCGDLRTARQILSQSAGDGFAVASGAKIVDLGCAPGGWLAILARAATAGGRVVGVDLAACRNVPAGAITIVGDILDASIAARAANELGSVADLVT